MVIPRTAALGNNKFASVDPHLALVDSNIRRCRDSPSSGLIMYVKGEKPYGLLPFYVSG